MIPSGITSAEPEELLSWVLHQTESPTFGGGTGGFTYVSVSFPVEAGNLQRKGMELQAIAASTPYSGENPEETSLNHHIVTSLIQVMGQCIMSLMAEKYPAEKEGESAFLVGLPLLPPLLIPMILKWWRGTEEKREVVA